jgi:hypothetical protein
MTMSLSHHASIRANQRGIPQALLQTLIEQADVETAVGGGCFALRVSRRRLQDVDVRRSFGGLIDRASKLAVVCSGDDGSIVTVLHDQGANGRRYRGRA